ncbi:MAG TPA: hypothetical protein VMY42_03420 [Thermoguttaceae bacterium]|nr:hypothetical protein [Thermoguttaceae bacterium]
MMDRLGNVLPRWQVLLPLGLVLVGLPWLLGQRNPPPRDEAPFTAPNFFPDGTSLTALPPPTPAEPARRDAREGPQLFSPQGTLSFPQPAEQLVPRVVAVNLANVLPAEANADLTLPEQGDGPTLPEPDNDLTPPEPDIPPDLTPPDAPIVDEQAPAWESLGTDEGRPQEMPPPSMSRLPSPPAVPRSEPLEQIARQADKKVRDGFELAGRRAYFAARAEFVGALRLIAQGLDAQRRTNAHSGALAAGLTALREAEDFFPAGSRLEADLDLSSIIGGHRTPVLRDTRTEDLTPMLALRSYFTFAQEQLAASAGHEVAGSMALHALGKLHATVATRGNCGVQAAESKAMTFYQAALLVHPPNYMASNDLGVLLARCGNYREAATAMQHSLSIHQQPTGWQNLATVYEQLGQTELARQARLQSTTASRAETSNGQTLRQSLQGDVVWVDPATFSQTSRGLIPVPQRTPGLSDPTPTGGPNPPEQAAENPAATTGGPLTGWRIPWELFSGRK